MRFRFLIVAVITLLAADGIYSFLQFYHTPIDGDLGNTVIFSFNV